MVPFNSEISILDFDSKASIKVESGTLNPRDIVRY